MVNSRKELQVVVDRDIPFLEGVLEPYAQVRYLPGDRFTREDVAKASALVIRTRTQCNAALLEGSTVEMIATATIGHDHIDLPYCQQQQIDVQTAAGCNARGVLQYVMAALAHLSTRDAWHPTQRTLGVVGVGHVGSLIAEYGARMGFRVVCCDPPRQRIDPTLGFLPLVTMLPQCDIVTLHVPLQETGPDSTLRLVDDAFLALLPTGNTLINSSRGAVVDQEALLDSLRRNHTVHAVIDTWNGEPLIHPELLARATLTTPHIAGYSLQGKAAGTAAVIRVLSRHYGLPLTDWYPPQVPPSRPNPTLTWTQLKEQINTYFNIYDQSTLLKNHPERFEELRNNYNYRNEFF